jgi:transcriptional regulator with XRE-family HTH domain
MTDKVKLRTKAGERIKGMRMLFGITQKDFAKMIDIPLARYKSIEILNTRAAEDVLAAACILFPNFMAFIVIEGKISLKALTNSDSDFERKAAERYDHRSLPADNIISSRFEDDR